MSRSNQTDAAALTAEKDRFLRLHADSLPDLVRAYISSDVPGKGLTGHTPFEAGLVQIIKGFESAVKRSFGRERSTLRNLCEREVEDLIVRTCEAFGLEFSERQATSTWFSDLYKETHYSLRLFKFVLDEIKTILSQKTGDDLLKFLLVLTPAAIWARLRQYLDLPKYRNHGEMQTLAPTSVRHREWAVPHARLDYTPTPDPLAVGNRLEIPEAVNLEQAVERLRRVIETAEHEVPGLHERLGHVLSALDASIVHARTSGGSRTAYQDYMRFLLRLAARAKLRLRADGPFLTTSFLEDQIRSLHTHELLSALDFQHSGHQSPPREGSDRDVRTLSDNERERLPHDLQRLVNSLAPFHPAERRERRAVVLARRMTYL